MRWERLFDDLEAQLDAAADADFEAEVADRTRHEIALVALQDRLRGSVGRSVELTVAGAGAVRAEIRRVGAGWLLGCDDSRIEVLVRTASVLAIRGLALASVADTSAVGPKLGLGHVLRVIARDRAQVTAVLTDGERCHGTIDRVGADHLDLAEHAPGEPRRTREVTSTRTISFAALSLVRIR